MATYVYVTDPTKEPDSNYQFQGALVSWTPNDTDPIATPSELAAMGRTSVSGLPALNATPPTAGQVYEWSASQTTVITTTAPPVANPVDPGAFIMLFTAAEDTAIYGSTDPQVVQWLRALGASKSIDLNSTLVANGLAYLVSQNLLQQARVAQIIANAPPST